MSSTSEAALVPMGGVCGGCVNRVAARPRRYLVCGAVLIIVGLTLVASGIFFPWFIEYTISNTVTELLVVSSPDSQRYEDWRINTNENAVAVYQNYYVWNLTNIDEVLNDANATPAFTEVGPYRYRKYQERVEPSFPQNGTLQQFRWRRWYEPLDSVDERTGVALDPLNDTVYSANVAYAGLVAQAGGTETLMVQGLTFLSLDSLFKLITGVFVVGIENLSANAMGAQRDALVQLMGDDVAAFTTQFADTPTLPGGGGELAEKWAEFGSPAAETGVATGMSADAVALLFNASFPYAVNIPFGIDSSTRWSYAQIESNVTGVPLMTADWNAEVDAGGFAETARITEAQCAALVAWRNAYNLRNVRPTIIETIKTNTGVDVPPESCPTACGWIQWTQAGMLPSGLNSLGQSPIVVEFTLWQKAAGKATIIPTIDVAQTAFYGPEGIMTSVPAYERFAAELAAGNYTAIEQLWGLNSTLADLVGEYTEYVRSELVQKVVLAEVGRDHFSAGLFVRLTPDELLWSYESPVLKAAGQPALAALQKNNTVDPIASLVSSGADDMNTINEYVEWQGRTTLCGVDVCNATGTWASTIPVVGTDGQQFAPAVESRTELLVWTEELLRTLPMVYYTDGDGGGWGENPYSFNSVELERFVVSPLTFAPNATYYQQFYGFANMSVSAQGAPLYICKPNMLDVVGPFAGRIDGMAPQRRAHDTYLGIEPITGTPLNARKRLQLNLYVPPGVSYDLYYNDTPADRMYPVLWAEEAGDITPDLGATLENTLYVPYRVRTGLWYAALSSGGVCAGIGLILVLLVMYARNLTGKLPGDNGPAYSALPSGSV